MNEEQKPKPKQPNELNKVLKTLAPFIVYICLFATFLLPFKVELTVLQYVSVCTILAHFSSQLNKLK